MSFPRLSTSKLSSSHPPPVSERRPSIWSSYIASAAAGGVSTPGSDVLDAHGNAAPSLGRKTSDSPSWIEQNPWKKQPFSVATYSPAIAPDEVGPSVASPAPPATPAQPQGSNRLFSNFTFGTRRPSAGLPTLKAAFASTFSPSVEVTSPSLDLPSYSSPLAPAPSGASEQPAGLTNSLQAERERRLEEHRWKNKERKEQLEVEEMQWKAQIRANERESSKQDEGFRVLDDAPPVPSLPSYVATSSTTPLPMERRMSISKAAPSLIVPVDSFTNLPPSPSRHRISRKPSQALDLPISSSSLLPSPVSSLPYSNGFLSPRDATFSQDPLRRTAENVDLSSDGGYTSDEAALRRTSHFSVSSKGRRKSSAPFAFDRDSPSPLPSPQAVTVEGDARSERRRGSGTSVKSFMPRKMSRKASTTFAAERLAAEEQEGRASLLWKKSKIGEDGEIEEEETEEASQVWDFEELTFSRRIAHVSVLLPYSCLALLVRLALSRLGDYAGSAIPPLVWSQAVGCALYGLFLGRREDLRALYPPLYTALAVGFAESITSFAGWMFDAFVAFSSTGLADRGGWQSAMDGVAQLLVTLLVAHASLSFGLHLSSQLPFLPTLFLTSPHSYRPTPTLDYLTTGLSLALYALVLCAFLILAPSTNANAWKVDVLYPLVVAPVGAVIRYYLGRANPNGWVLGGGGGKRKGKNWPVGTFSANIFGCALLAAMSVLSRVDLGTAALGGSGCSAVLAVQVGVAGSVTSLGAFAVEARSEWTSSWRKWAYVAGSVAAGMSVMIAVVGGVQWSGLGMSAVCRAR